MTWLKEVLWWFVSLFFEKYVLKIKTSRREAIEKELDEISESKTKIYDELTEILRKRRLTDNVKERETLDNDYNVCLDKLRLLIKREKILRARLQTCISVKQG